MRAASTARTGMSLLAWLRDATWLSKWSMTDPAWAVVVPARRRLISVRKRLVSAAEAPTCSTLSRAACPWVVTFPAGLALCEEPIVLHLREVPVDGTCPV